MQKPLEYKESYLVLLRRRKDTDTITDTSDTSLKTLMCTMLRYLYIADITKRFPAQIAFMIRIKSKVTLFSSLFSCLQAINLRRQDRLSNKKKRSSPPNGFRVSSVDKISKVFLSAAKKWKPFCFLISKIDGATHKGKNNFVPTFRGEW